MVIGLMLPSTVAFVAGLVAVGTSVPDARLRGATAARVRTWMWLDKSRIDSRQGLHASEAEPARH